MRYVSTTDAIKGDGLRMFIVQAMPSPWGQAAKAMMEHKGLDCALSHWEGGGANTEIVQWSGANSAPVVAWNDEPPIHGWLDILFLLQRLQPEKSLLPDSTADRARVLGLSHEICGEEGLGWNRRLSMFRAVLDSGQAPPGFSDMAAKYGMERSKPENATTRQVDALGCLSDTLRENRAAGSDYFVGNGVTALDFYWAAFSYIMDPPPPEQCPMADMGRGLFAIIEPEVKAALAPNLMEHRAMMMDRYFAVPMEM